MSMPTPSATIPISGSASNAVLMLMALVNGNFSGKISPKATLIACMKIKIISTSKDEYFNLY